MAKRVILGICGRRLRCELCDEVLVTAAPIIWRGELKLIGAERMLIAVDFASMNRLTFRHAEAGACPAQRPAPPA
jgi:hypothetical protein